MKRWILIIVGLLVAAGGGVGYYLFNNFEELARLGLEEVLKRALKVDVSVGSVSIRPLSGRVAVRDLVIGNPKGFASKESFRFASISVKADIGSFRSGVPTIEDITVDKPEITMEVTTDGNNLLVLLDQVAPKKDESATPQATKPAPKDEGPSFLIQRIGILGGKVRVALPLTGGAAVPISLSEIELRDLGGGGQPVTLGKALTLVIGTILLNVKIVGVDVLPGAVLNAIGDGLNALPGAILGAMALGVKGVGVVWDGATFVVAGAAGLAVDAAGVALDGAMATGSMAVDAAVVTTTLAADGATSAATLAIDGVTSTATLAADGVTSATGAAVDTMKDAAGSITGSVTGLFGSASTPTPTPTPTPAP